MFDSVRNNKRIVQGFLALITLPFALWGVDSYVRNASSGAELATVGETKIGQGEFQEAMREQSERMQQQLRERFDPKLMESPEAKRSVMQGLINQRLLALAAKDAHVMVSDDMLAQFIAQVPALQEDGKFSPERYQALVASRGMSKEGFEARLRQDMAMQQLVQPIGDAVIVNKQSSSQWVNTQLEQRIVAEYRISPEAFLKSVKLDAGMAEEYYESNRSKFELPEQIKVDYVVLDQEAIAQQISVVDADIEARYKAHPERYTQPETRRASHILLTLAKDAKEAEISATQSKAEEILAQLKANPKAFSDLAKKHSQDPGSAQKGGDLDWFGRGMMVKAFEDAVYGLKQDEMSGLVRSDFGIHIIRVTGVRPERVTPLGEVKGDIVAELKREAATRKYAEAVEAFNNLVYEQPDSLQPAADQWKLAIRHSEWLRKGDKLSFPFDNGKLQAAIFSEDALRKKQNSEAVEIVPGKLVSARVVEHQPASLQPFDSVKEQIKQYLTREQANKLAILDGETRLASLEKGDPQDVKWGAQRKVLRAAPQGLPRDAVRPIFSADVAKLPAYVGATSSEGGYTLYKVSDVIAAGKDDPRSGVLGQQYARLVAEEEFGAWMAALRNRYPVIVNDHSLLGAER